MAKRFPTPDLSKTGIFSLFKNKRLPAIIELILGTTGHYDKVRTRPIKLPNFKGARAKWYIPKNKYHFYQTFPPRDSGIKKYWRGETLEPDEKYISEAGLQAQKDFPEATPGSWHTSEPLTATEYVVRSSKGDMGAEVDNPGVLRSITTDEIIEIDPEWAGKNYIGYNLGSLQNFPEHIQKRTKISLIPTLIARLRKLGFLDQEIFSTVRKILSKKKASGEKDWKWFKEGGIISLIS